MEKTHAKRSRAIDAGLAVTLAFSAVLLAGAPRVDPGSAEQAFDFALADINPRSATHGRTLSIQDLYGERGLVLQFIASWCKPCRDELPEIQALYADAALPIVFVAADESGMTESVLIVAERSAVTAPILFAPEERVPEIEAHYKYAVLPATYFIDRDGRIRRLHEGAMGAERLADMARTALAP